MIQSTLVTTDPPNSYFNGSYHNRQTDITDITDRPKFKALFGF